MQTPVPPFVTYFMIWEYLTIPQGTSSKSNKFFVLRYVEGFVRTMEWADEVHRGVPGQMSRTAAIFRFPQQLLVNVQASLKLTSYLTLVNLEPKKFIGDCRQLICMYYYNTKLYKVLVCIS